MPIKERRIKLLLLFFLLKDISFDYLALEDYYLKTFDLTLNQKTKGTLSAMIRDGLIEKQEQTDFASTSDKPLYRLTENGFYTLCLYFPYFRFIRDDWDGVWRIISYEIPEDKRHIRDRLRREMKGWGLGPWHRSFWLTAHPIISSFRDLVYGREEEGYVQAFESTHMFGDVENLVEKVWGRAELEKKYKELFKAWHSILSKGTSKEEKFQEVLYAFIRDIKDDPGLPANLVGAKWIGREAFDIFKEMRSILLAPAQVQNPSHVS